MSKEETVHITFEITIAKDQYSYKPNGQAKAVVNIPLFSINELDAGNIFDGILHAALSDYYENKKKEEEEEEQDD